ncbi:hypothetical protein EC843_101990 [Buttiauxella sp. JUb87]|uniref:hypothetical protein n=1 Tax=Buttiauxella sp. JUb87 TaxID=2485129 RepID=UPI00105E5ACE|nr:hypothetical protein [Buttiauxella sp. JUb87]TDN54931.1 hypothetical protein EC843_101990 [Buttiauxella sp. JUb87]
MIISRYGPITFRHFQDNPYWAAAAGYDFNYFDCLSASTQVMSNVADNAWDEVVALPDTEVRDLPAFTIKVTVASILLAILTFTYPILALVIHMRCKTGREKYKGPHNSTITNNMNSWIRQCERKWGRKYG